MTGLDIVGFIATWLIGGNLVVATRKGFTPVVREQLFKKLRGLEIGSARAC